MALAMVFTLVSCFEQPVTTTTTTTGDGGGDTSSTTASAGDWDWGTTNGGTGDNTTSNPTTTDGGSCTGPACSPHHDFTFMLSGYKWWKPGNYTHNLAIQAMPNFLQASEMFSSDNRFKLRLTVLEQPKPAKPNSGASDDDKKRCWDRVQGQAGDEKSYTKLSFDVYLVNIIKDSNGNFTLGPRYRGKHFSNIGVNQSTGIIDYSNLRQNSTYGTAVEIANVTTDNGEYVRTASCWQMRFEFANDYTQDLY